MREQQDKALRESERQDRERILASRRERERKEREEREAAEELARKYDLEQLRKAEIEQRRFDRSLWRRWARRNLLKDETLNVDDVKKGNALRVQLRLPQGMTVGKQTRAVRVFDKTGGEDGESLKQVWIWAETLFIPEQDDLEDDPEELPGGIESTEIPKNGDVLRLFTTYPRKEIPKVGDDAEAWKIIVDGGGGLIMELEREGSGEEEEEEGNEEEDGGRSSNE